MQNRSRSSSLTSTENNPNPEKDFSNSINNHSMTFDTRRGLLQPTSREDIFLPVKTVGMSGSNLAKVITKVTQREEEFNKKYKKKKAKKYW